MKTEGCKCQSCGKIYQVDIIVPDDIWSKISPKKSEAGLLCGSCIMSRIENLFSFGMFFLTNKL